VEKKLSKEVAAGVLADGFELTGEGTGAGKEAVASGGGGSPGLPEGGGGETARVGRDGAPLPAGVLSFRFRVIFWPSGRE